MNAAPVDTWRWIDLRVVVAIHDRQSAEHGGADGIRDLGAIEAALAGPMNRAAYANPDIGALAAAYAYGLTKHHGFVDGNKRTAWVVARLFLADNGQTLVFDPHDAIGTMEGVASGNIGEDELSHWFRRRLNRSAS